MFSLGFQFALGAFAAYALGALALDALGKYLYRRFPVEMDDSDKSPSERSGLSVHVDHKTGVEYLSSPKGGLIARRMEKDDH